MADNYDPALHCALVAAGKSCDSHVLNISTHLYKKNEDVPITVKSADIIWSSVMISLHSSCTWEDASVPSVTPPALVSDMCAPKLSTDPWWRHTVVRHDYHRWTGVNEYYRMRQTENPNPKKVQVKEKKLADTIIQNAATVPKMDHGWWTLVLKMTPRGWRDVAVTKALRRNVR